MNVSKADLHMHTTASDGLHEPEAVIDHIANHTDLRVIAITDHDTLDGATAAYQYWKQHRDHFAHLEVIRGVEVSSADGHILGLFIHEPIPYLMSAEDTVRAIHEQGGLAIAAHPFTPLEAIFHNQGVGKLIASDIPFDAVEVLNSVPIEFFANQKTARFNRSHRQLPELGGSDAHHNSMLGTAYTLFEGETPADLVAAIRTGNVKAAGRIANTPQLAWDVAHHLLKHRRGLNFKRPDASRVVS